MTTISRTTAPGMPFWLVPIAWLGGSVIGVVSYLGGLALLLLSAVTSVLSFAKDEEAPAFWGAMKHELSWILMAGLPLVGLVHVGMGSFLSMQAYFGSTFVDGTGAVVGVGLLRNLATLMTGLTLSGLLAGRMIPELLRLKPVERTDAGAGRDSRAGASRSAAAPATASPGLDRYAAPRMAAAAVAGVLLSLWGVGVGTVIGWQSAGSLLGLSSETYFMMFYQMVWFRDVVGMIVKGSLFGFIIATVCCFEGLRGWRRSGPELSGENTHGEALEAGSLNTPIVRAASLSMAAILLANMTWFMLVYHAVPVFGPSLLAPPGP
jgi:phospholipid/cholesterol/gamma-HCH transport system permease protein